jgi:hypothetical protein
VPGSGYAGFVVDKGLLGQVFYRYYGNPCLAFHRLLYIHLHPSSSSGVDTIGLLIVDSVPLHPNGKKSKLSWDLLSVGQSVLVSGSHLELMTRIFFLFDNCGFLDVGHPL